MVLEVKVVQSSRYVTTRWNLICATSHERKVWFLQSHMSSTHWISLWWSSWTLTLDNPLLVSSKPSYCQTLEWSTSISVMGWSWWVPCTITFHDLQMCPQTIDVSPNHFHGKRWWCLLLNQFILTLQFLRLLFWFNWANIYFSLCWRLDSPSSIAVTIHLHCMLVLVASGSISSKPPCFFSCNTLSSWPQRKWISLSLTKDTSRLLDGTNE